MMMMVVIVTAVIGMAMLMVMVRVAGMVVRHAASPAQLAQRPATSTSTRVGRNPVPRMALSIASKAGGAATSATVAQRSQANTIWRFPFLPCSPWHAK
jgi:hypothetical protein